MTALSGSCEDYGEVIEIGPVVDTMLACEVAIIFLGVVGVCLVGHALEIHETLDTGGQLAVASASVGIGEYVFAGIDRHGCGFKYLILGILSA